MSQVHSRSRLQAVLCRRKVSHCAFNKFYNKLANIYDGHFPNSVEKPLDGFQGKVQSWNNLKQLMIRHLFVYFILVIYLLNYLSLCGRYCIQFLFPRLSLHASVLLCNYSISLLVSWWSRSSCRSSGLNWRLCRICSNVSQKHWSVKRMSGYSWKSEPKLCSNRLWNRKWLLKGGPRFVVHICWGQCKFINKQKWNFLWNNVLNWVFVLTHQMLKLMVVPACRSGSGGRIIVVDWGGCWMMLKPSSAVGSQRETTRS